MTDKIRNKSLCALPFMHVQGDPDGRVKLCCLAKDYVTTNTGKVANLGEDKIVDFFNSDYMKNVRKQMLNGERVAACNGCYTEEDAGGISQRKTYTSEWLKDVPSLEQDILASEQNDYYMEPKIKYFDFRFGNMCNLKCRSCGPVNSIQLLKESREITHPKVLKFFQYDNNTIDSINDWYQTEVFTENLASQENNIEQIYFTGGEPTIIEQNYEILQRLVDSGQAPNVTLIFSSNMTNVQDRFVNLILQFKAVRFLASCEGYGDIHEYLRFPAKWSVFEKNIRKLAQYDAYKIQIMCTPVVQSVNLLDISKFFQWIEDINAEFGFERIKTLPIVLTFPRYLDLEILPNDMKKEGLRRLDQFIETSKYAKNSIHFMGRVNFIRDKCLKDSYNETLLRQFQDFTTMLDEHRGQSLADVNPALYELLQSLK